MDVRTIRVVTDALKESSRNNNGCVRTHEEEQ
jgi:hypothetical protein